MKLFWLTGKTCACRGAACCALTEDAPPVHKSRSHKSRKLCCRRLAHPSLFSLTQGQMIYDERYNVKREAGLSIAVPVELQYDNFNLYVN
jgi:hypothetical protein